MHLKEYQVLYAALLHWEKTIGAMVAKKRNAYGYHGHDYPINPQLEEACKIARQLQRKIAAMIPPKPEPTKEELEGEAGF